MISLSFDGVRSFIPGSVTEVGITPPEWKLGGGGFFFAGSCFAENLQRELAGSGLKAEPGPFGNIYNPESLAEAAALLEEGGGIREGDCFSENGSFRHFMFHSLISAPSAGELAQTLNRGLAHGRSFLEKAECAVITLGTAWVYRLTDSGKTVSNCHRLPASAFSRSCLTPAEAAASLKKAAGSFRRINPDIKIVVSISPVRHLRDDAAANSLSKAVLRCAADEVCREGEGLWYYPSFEIMIDELRDYRWYTDDLCHPSPAAVGYIISRFLNTAADDGFKAFLKSWLPLVRDLGHRPLRPDSEQYRAFREKLTVKLEKAASESGGRISGDWLQTALERLREG